MRARGPIGENWWARRFVDEVESGGDTGRLSRGRSYARGGAVERILVESGRVSGEVAGSARYDYRSAFHTAPLSEARAEQVIDRLAGAEAEETGNALEDGMMPPGAEDALRAVGAEMFPPLRKMRPVCSCPDNGFPCKHVAALLYVFADAIDEDPLLLLGWHGVSPALLLERLEEAGGGVRPPNELDVQVEPLPEGAEEFWAASEPLPLPGPQRPLNPLAYWDAPIPLVAEALEPIYEALAEADAGSADRGVGVGADDGGGGPGDGHG
ncbi:SWIM zinc finger family protein [Nocardiopsis sp. RSe5-2]|uniref:SWIM zinc finger family protein n=1 Tax=Nocardiopsis endophytica TaxID=3018445 RepID=A0ABT4TXP2_9ACTN|nr:SWIM zinc finger family protein [Nocardiopsis endophytica]MDA2809462.1 SWIM zinc finger family protein [Nocardiopsis endophytica]